MTYRWLIGAPRKNINSGALQLSVKFVLLCDSCTSIYISLFSPSVRLLGTVTNFFVQFCINAKNRPNTFSKYIRTYILYIFSYFTITRGLLLNIDTYSVYNLYRKSYFYIEKWTFKIMCEVCYRAKRDKKEAT